MGLVHTSTTAGATQYNSNHHVFVAADGTSIFAMFDNGGTLYYCYSTDAGSTWSAEVQLTTNYKNFAGGAIDGTDHIDIAYKNSSGNNLLHQRLAKATWTSGGTATEDTVGAIDAGQNEAAYVNYDGSGNVWATCGDFFSGGNTLANFYAPTSNTTSWTLSGRNSVVRGPSSYSIGMSVQMFGKYLMNIYLDNVGRINHYRLDTTGTLTAWGTLQTNAGTSTYNSNALAAAYDGTNGVLVVTSEPAGTYLTTPSFIYSLAGDTWSSGGSFGGATQDVYPSLIAIGTTIYCVWGSYSASNSYAVVYNTRTAGGSWGTPATIVASGSNNLWENAGGMSSLLVTIFTQGTSSPYNVEAATVSIGGGAIFIAPAPKIISQAIARSAYR